MRIICMADLHGEHYNLKRVPAGDVLVIAGDIEATSRSKSEVFNNWLGGLDYKHKILVAGNHDFYPYHHTSEFKKIITNAVYLENEEVVIDGVKFYGSPITPTFYNWAFMKDRGDEISRYWANIPDDVEVLVTHGPPYKILDISLFHGEHCGCWDLMHTIDSRLKKLKVHVFGHIHNQGSQIVEKNGVKFVNASVLDENYEVRDESIIVIDL